MSNRVKTLTNAMDVAIDYKISLLDTCLPAKIEKYDSKSGSSVKPLVDIKTRSGEVIERPVINGVPVWNNFSGGASIDMPIKKGDTGILLFCSAAIDSWLEDGLSEPEDSRNFDYNDAIFIPGINNFVSKSKKIDNDNLRLHFSNGNFVINDDGKVAIGNSSVELLDLFEQLITALELSTTQTLLGNQPLDKAVDGTFTQIKAKLQQIKGSI